MRRPRIKAEGSGYYHCMSRAIERRYILGPKEKFRTLMRNLSDFSGLEIITYVLMDNHFHVLVHVPSRRELSDEELLTRLRFI